MKPDPRVPANRLQVPLAQQLSGPLDGLGDWAALVTQWRESPAGRATIAAVDARLAAGATVYPALPLRALALTPRSEVRVVILGQDPYHGPGQAEGLAFSVPGGLRPPPSLRNIFIELRRDLGIEAGARTSLQPWAERGVLLLNTVLTVEEGIPASHAKLGWQTLTDAICVALAADGMPIVWMLWGAHAQALVSRVAPGRQWVLRSNHPSPLAARRPPLPFIGNGHFSSANRHLLSTGRGAVDWSLA